MNRERAETYLRLLAEAELRDPALASPPAPQSADAPFLTAPITVIRAAWALAARRRPEAAAAPSSRRFPRRFAGGRPLARMSHLMPSVPALAPPPAPPP